MTTPKRVVDFLRERDTFRNKIMEIVGDVDEKSYNNNGKPWKSSRILRVKPNFFIFSLFIIFLHFSFSHFFIFSFFSFVFRFFSFFHFSCFFHDFHFSMFFVFFISFIFFIFFIFSFFHFLHVSTCFYMFLHASSCFFMFLFFFFCFPLFFFIFASFSSFFISFSFSFLGCSKSDFFGLNCFKISCDISLERQHFFEPSRVVPPWALFSINSLVYFLK